MPTDRQLDDRISRWLEAEAPTQLPDRVLRATFERTRTTRQKGGWRAVLGRSLMNRTFFALGGAAAVIVVGVLAIGLYFNQPGFGGPPETTPLPTPPSAPTVVPTAAPSPAPTPSASPVADPPTGRLNAGTYVAHPFGPPNDGMSFTFIVRSNSWEALHGRDVPDSEESGVVGLLRFGESGVPTMGMGFHRIRSLNGDPCNHPGTADDVAIGPTVDDLVAGLTSSTEYETSDPTDVSLGGYSGKQVVVTMPADPAAVDQCAEGYVIWNFMEGGFYDNAFGPENRWTLWILDVEGQRVVIRISDFEDSPADLRQELQSIVDSIVITAP